MGQANYDESKIPSYELPALWDESLDMTASLWENETRLQHIETFKKEMFGHFPLEDLQLSYDETQPDVEVLNGLGLLSNISISFSNNQKTHKADLLIIRPKEVENAPIFLGLNFYGNHTIMDDTRIPLPKGELMINKSLGILSKIANDDSRGVRSHRWPIELILKEGFALGVLYCGDLDPDYDDDFKNGVHQLVDSKEYQPTTLAAWAAGLQAALTYCEQDENINHEQAVAIGHSRLGKAALWAGVIDERFAMVVSNNSGCGGAALSRRAFGETVNRINTNFPHWFTESFKKYNGEESKLPFDQHTLLSLVAPRPLYVASASEDLWADPKGELTSLKETAPVYGLYNSPSILHAEIPPTNSVYWADKQGYHIRKGKHDITSFDWQLYLDFAKLQLRK